jgi:leucyl-tRNA synthetase
MSTYDPEAFERSWQDRWQKDGLYARPRDPIRPSYELTMYPYPSGNLHIGHWFAYVPPDAHARFRRMQGHDVFFPFGFDAFGLPAENAAIRHGFPPREWTLSNVARMREQLRTMGTMIDWSAEVVTCEPEYYKWNQWFFIQFLRAGLAYRKRAAVDFCPSCNTTLAREQVVGEDRVCERCGTPVERRELTQWFLAITRYAEELLSGLESLEWPERVKLMQRNWIGRSPGAHIHFRAEGGMGVSVFTTRPDTLFGAAAVVLAPEHEAVDGLTSASARLVVDEYRNAAARRTDIDRLAEDRAKTGVPTGGTLPHPMTGASLPVWIADYVLPTYGTGAVMLVPAHDERDHAFAMTYGIPFTAVISPPDPVAGGGPYTGPGTMMNSPGFDGLVSKGRVAEADWASVAAESGLPESVEHEAKAAITAALSERGAGDAAVVYRLRDWLVSRQRYWGTPIPVIHCPACGEVPVPEADLPVTLPEGVEFRPTGESPLKFADEWRNVPCPACGAPAERDTDTLDTFVDSSWYQYRYLSPHYDDGPFDKSQAHWIPVEQYTGGIEHATMHLLYTRFWTKVMRDLGLVAFDEPMLRLFNQGTILGEDSSKMSKSRGNVTDPDSLVAAHGADAVRCYLMFIGPWDQGGPWDSRGIQGVIRWLRDTWALATLEPRADGTDPADGGLAALTHRTLASVTADYDQFRFNTAIAALMTLRNELKDRQSTAAKSEWDDAIRLYLLMLAPMAPHIAEELWRLRGLPYSIHTQRWPEADPRLTAVAMLEVAVQVNGRVRERLMMAADAIEKDAVAAALQTEAVQRELAGREPRKVFYVPGRLVNVVV